MYKNYNIFINVILLILIIFIVNYFLKNNKKLEKYTSQTPQTPQGLITTSIDNLINDMNTIQNEHNINESNLQDIITKTQDVINQINNKITQLQTLIGNDEEISQLRTTINTLTQNISNLEQMIVNLNNNKENNLQTQQELEREINNLINLNNFLDEHPRYNGEIIESFSNNNIQVVNIDGNPITNSTKFNINTNNVKIKIGHKYYLKKLTNPEFVHINDTNTITDNDTVPDIPDTSWLNIMGYQKVKEITTGNTISNPNGESICAFAVWPNWGSTWENTNKNNLPSNIILKDNNGTELYNKTFNWWYKLWYWYQIYNYSDDKDEDRCQVYFLPSNSTSKSFQIVHDGSIRCAILKNDNDNNNCNSVTIIADRDCPSYIAKGWFRINRNNNENFMKDKDLTSETSISFTNLNERVFFIDGYFKNDARYKVNGQWCDNNILIKSMNLPGYNLFNNDIISKHQTMQDRNKDRMWNRAWGGYSFAWRGYYSYNMRKYHNALRELAQDYSSNYLDLESEKTVLIDSTFNNDYLNYNYNNKRIEYINKTSNYNKYNFSLTDSLSDATDFKLVCNSNDTDCSTEPDIFRTGRTYKIKTASGDKYVMDDLNNIISDDSQGKLTQQDIDTINKRTNHTVNKISSSNHYILNVL